MTPKDILVVSADRQFSVMMETELASLGFAVSTSGSLGAIEESLRAHVPRLMILDLDISAEPPWDVLGGLRRDPRTRRMAVVAVSERCRASRQVVSGLHLGAVEYVLKPCDGRVLAARIESLLKAFDRPVRPPAQGAAVATGDGLLEIDLDAHRCVVRCDSAAKELSLSPMEFELLARLLARKNSLVNKAELVRALWPNDWSAKENVATLAQFVAHLRRKLGPLKSRLKTVWGLGYRFDD